MTRTFFSINSGHYSVACSAPAVELYSNTDLVTPFIVYIVVNVFSVCVFCQLLNRRRRSIELNYRQGDLRNAFPCA